MISTGTHINRRRKRGERSNGLPYDVLAPDGVAEYGWRKVRKGGVVKFVHRDWQHDALLPFIGEYVTVKVGDVHCCDVDVFKEYPTGDWYDTFICNIAVEEKLPTPLPGYKYEKDEDDVW